MNESGSNRSGGTEALRRRREEWVRVVNAGDLEGYMALLADDAVWIPPGQPSVAGKWAIGDWLKPFFEQFAYAFTISGERARVAGDWAVERGEFTSDMTPRSGGAPMSHSGTYLTMWRRGTDSEWYIERYVDVSDL